MKNLIFVIISVFLVISVGCDKKEAKTTGAGGGKVGGPITPGDNGDGKDLGGKDDGGDKDKVVDACKNSPLGVWKVSDNNLVFTSTTNLVGEYHLLEFTEEQMIATVFCDNQINASGKLQGSRTILPASIYIEGNEIKMNFENLMIEDGDNRCKIQIPNQVLKFSYSCDDDELTLTDEEDVSQTFERVR